MKRIPFNTALCALPLLAIISTQLKAQTNPIFSEPFSCPPGEIFHTVDHADLTTGSLPSGITVTTAVTDIAGTTTVSTPGITLAGAGSGFVATTPFIDGGGALRFVNTDNEAVQVVYTFSEPVTNPFMFIQSDGPEQGTTFQLFQADGVTPIGITKIDGDAEMVVTGGSLVENTDVSAGAQNHTAYYQVQDNTARSTIILRIFNNTPHALDGYNVGIGVCVPDPTTSFPALPCGPGEKVYTVDHDDLTTGTLPGIEVTTTVTKTGTPTVSTVSAAGLAGAFVNTPNNIEGGGALRFVTTDGEAADVLFTFSSAVTNPFVYIGTDGPEPDTLTELFEADGTTPIPFVKIDGEDEFGVNNGRTIVNTDTTATNRQGYVQVQDGTPRTSFILRITNGGVFGLDGHNVGIGVCLPCLDLSVESRSGMRVGEGVVNTTGSSQEVKLVSRQRIGVSTGFRVQNQCLGDEVVAVSGSPSNRFWTVRYQVNGENVTAAMSKGTFSKSVIAGTSAYGRVRITPSKKLGRGSSGRAARKTRTFSVRGSLVSDPAAKDVVRVKAQTR